ncbi:MAG: choline-sulfatase [Gammaproteobacteria bacterium]|jgi:choline-sulfatase
MRPQNLLFIFSDEHTREITGCYGNQLIRTPNIDALAARGTRFDNAYTNCPICVPARASLASGRYVHDIRMWDNGFPYYGEPASWGHRLMQQNHQVNAIGKLHYRSNADATGWNSEINTLHVVDGIGDDSDDPGRC